MICPKCSSNNNENNKYCLNCGTPLIQDNKEIIEATKFNAITEKEIKDGNNSKIIGIIAIILSIPLSILSIPLSIIGITVGISARNKGTLGIVLNVIAIILSVISIISIGIVLQNNIKNDYIGTYKCMNLLDYESNNEFNPRINLELGTDTFKMDYYKDNSLITGTYEEISKEEERNINANEYIFNFNATYRSVEGKVYTNPYTTQYSLIINKDGDAVLMNTISKSMYMCKKDM